MTDTGTCPHCDQTFDVTSYGYGVSCPHCGKSIDVLPDEPQLWIETRWGMIGIAGNLADVLEVMT